jgi:hypothetical protein
LEVVVVLKRTSVLLLVLALGLAACGGGGGGVSGEGQALADAIAVQMTADTTAGNPFAKEADAKCFAEGLVGGVGVERLTALGVTVDNVAGADTFIAQLTVDEQGKVADAALGCIDLKKAIKEGAVSSGLPEAQAQCLADGLSKDLLKKAFLSQYSGATYDPTADPEFMAAITKCFTG